LATFKSTLIMNYNPAEGETAESALEDYFASFDAASSFEKVGDECAHETQRIDDRQQFHCCDCGEELGR
jgi:hypothetical protein